jgi:hypothetical protein
VDATLRMVDAKTGETLWRQRVQAAERGGALMKKGQVVDFIKDQVRSFRPEVKYLRVADAAVHKVLKGFPDPPQPAGAEEPAAQAAGGAPRLAVMPMKAKRSAWKQPGELLRRELAANLQDGPFDVMELRQVPDETAPPGADLLLQGTVTAWGRRYLVLQSWVSAEMQLELIEASSGAVIWSAKRKNARHAGILKGPTGYKSVVTGPITGLKKSNLERVAMHLARTMAEELKTSPALQTYLSEPKP